MKNEELRKQVIDLQGQIRKWKGQKARWDEIKKELERERDDLRKEVHKAASEKRDLEVKLEKTVNKAEDEKVCAKRAIEEAALKAFSEKRHLEEKLGMAVKQVKDFKAAAKNAIYEAASTKKCYKIGLSNFVAYLATSEGRSLGDYVNAAGKFNHFTSLNSLRRYHTIIGPRLMPQSTWQDLKVKLEKATKQAESVETYAKKAINDAHDAQASGKAVASTTYCYKICIDNFVVSLGISGEDKSLEDHVSKLVKAIPFHARAPADMAVEVPGQEGDVG
ncbi:hypothetical protein ACET3Z_026297 [Daucus carota]